MKNLLDLHAAAGDPRALTRLTGLYRTALFRAGYNDKEIDEELDGLWEDNNRPRENGTHKN